MTEIRIATRASELATTQARWVARCLESATPELSTTLVEVSTSGDKDRISPVTTLTEVGAFVRAIQEAVLDGRADLAVHSCKDLPVDGPDELATIYPRRERPWDVLCGHDLDSLPDGARVGTGSPRRAAQLRLLRPDVEVAGIRGNVETRLRKMMDGEYDAVVLAEAGLRRLGRADEIGHRFAIEQMVPAPGQAALAVEYVLEGPLRVLVDRIEDPATRAAVETERALLSATGAGCRSALGAHASVGDGVIEVAGFVEDEAGPRFASGRGATPPAAAAHLARELGL